MSVVFLDVRHLPHRMFSGKIFNPSQTAYDCQKFSLKFWLAKN